MKARIRALIGLASWCKRLTGICTAAAVVMLASAAITAHSASAIEPAQAAQGPPLNVAFLVSNRGDVCYDPGDVAAIKRFATVEQERLNRIGGVAGRPLQIRFLDDDRDPKKTAANVRSALADPQMLALIGLANSNRAQSTFKELGAEIDRTGIPFISDLSVNSIFAPHPNVFTTRSSQDTERIPVIAAFIKTMEFTRPVFVGIEGMVFSTTLGDGVRKALGDAGFAADHRLKLTDDKLDPAKVTATITDIGAKGTDILLLKVGSARTGQSARSLQ
ncbi:MAG: ABC transporter substrate-binding protein [Hyphomicrobium sp.]